MPTDGATSIEALLALYGPLIARLEACDGIVEERSAFVDEALGVSARPGFETFMCLSRLRFEPFAYQLEAAARVLRHMQGRALLADEVGLGKTIEAGVVVSGVRPRGVPERAPLPPPPRLLG